MSLADSSRDFPNTGLLGFCRNHSAALIIAVMVWASFALFDILKTAYFNGNTIDYWRYSLRVFYLFSPWILFTACCGWLSIRLPLIPFSHRNMALHMLSAVAIAILHGMLIASSFWIFLPQVVAQLSFSYVFIEQFFGWAPYEVLVYFGCIAVWHWRLYLRPPVPQTDSTGAEKPLALVADGVVHYVKPQAIDWIQADRNYVVVHTAGKQFKVRDSLTNLSEELDSGKFIQVHRGAIVNITRVTKVESRRVELLSGDRVPLSRRRRTTLLQQLHKSPAGSPPDSIR